MLRTTAILPFNDYFTKLAISACFFLPLNREKGEGEREIRQSKWIFKG